MNNLDNAKHILPVGKLPAELLARLLEKAPSVDPRVILGPGVGLDCAVIDDGDKFLVFKSDPITFATDQVGWYAVQVNCNDIATTGATPLWFLATILLPEKHATAKMAEEILTQVFDACKTIGVAVIGGHTEITFGIERPIVVATMVGEVARERLVTPRGATPGDRILLSKGVPIEATSILARELPDRLRDFLDEVELRQAEMFLFEPGISILREARLAVSAGKVNAMHDPTEGGLITALWELAEASGQTLWVDLSAVPVPSISRKMCQMLGIDPLAAIASGALLLTAPPKDAEMIRSAWEKEGILCAEIGGVEGGPAAVWEVRESGRQLLWKPVRDEIAKLF